MVWGAEIKGLVLSLRVQEGLRGTAQIFMQTVTLSPLSY